MPILLILFLVGASAPVPWPAPPFDWGARTATTIMLVALVLPLVAHCVLAHGAVAKGPRFAEKYHRLRRLVGLAHFALSIAAIALGWGWVINDRVQPAPFAELLVPLPFLVGVWLSWLIHYDAEKALRPAGSPFWTRGGLFVHRMRPFALLALFPLISVAAQQSLTRYWPEVGRSEWLPVLLVFATPVLVVLMPFIARFVLGFRSLSPGPKRDKLETTAKRLGFTCTDWLIWPTQQTVVNAMVMGVVPRVRYVVFSDLLLNEFSDSEIDAVLGHEIGHARHGHLLYYTVFLGLSILLIVLGIDLLRYWGEAVGIIAVNDELLLFLPPLILGAAYMFFVFGFVSRKCERQADLFGVRTVASGTTEGHPYANGVYTMARALEKVAAFNGMENSYGLNLSVRQRFRQWLFAWTHGSIGSRLTFLFRTLEDEDLERRTQRNIRAMQWLVLLALIMSLVALGYLLGPDRLWKML